MKVFALLALILAVASAGSLDYYTFTMEVPQVACDTHSCESQDKGNLGPTSLNIHGLWPSATDGNHPEDCQKNIYDPSLLQPQVKSGMDSNWVGLYNSTYWFRWHEYGKHGTCFEEKSGYLRLKSDDQVTQMNAYFNKALSLKSSFNIEAQIFAGEQSDKGYKFTADGIRAAISKAVGVKDILVECSYNHNTQKQSLSTIEICIDLSFNAVDCNKVRDTSKGKYTSTCRDNEDVYVEKMSN